VFCIYLRTNSDLCQLQHKLIGFYNRDEKCLQRGTDWVFKYSGLRFVFRWLFSGLMMLVRVHPMAELVNNELDAETVAHFQLYLGAATEKTMKGPRLWANISFRHITNKQRSTTHSNTMDPFLFINKHNTHP